MDSNIIPISGRAQQPSQPSTPALPSLSDHQLEPCNAKQGTGELLACLTLVAPSGMTAEDRTQWAAVARQTLTGIPYDLLERGCRKARATCRFASEIVPTIFAEVQGSWDARKRNREHALARYHNRNAPRLEQKEPDYITADEFRELMKTLIPGQAA